MGNVRNRKHRVALPLLCSDPQLIGSRVGLWDGIHHRLPTGETKMYLITDDYGTYQTCWRWSTVLVWLSCASPDAAVFNYFTGRLLVVRSFKRVY